MTLRTSTELYITKNMYRRRVTKAADINVQGRPDSGGRDVLLKYFAAADYQMDPIVSMGATGGY